MLEWELAVVGASLAGVALDVAIHKIISIREEAAANEDKKER